MAGYDLYDSNIPTLEETNKLSPVSGIFHGIPTFPAFLGLFIKLFGLSNMQMIQSIFYLCSVFFVLFTAENFNLKKSSEILSVSIAALSPVVIWVTKSALTEAFLCLIFSGFLFFITDKENKASGILSVLMIWAFSFFHVTIYTIIPLFIVIYFIMYFETENRRYIYYNILSVVGFVIGITMMMYISPIYTFNNIQNGLKFFGK